MRVYTLCICPELLGCAHPGPIRAARREHHENTAQYRNAENPSSQPITTAQRDHEIAASGRGTLKFPTRMHNYAPHLPTCEFTPFVYALNCWVVLTPAQSGRPDANTTKTQHSTETPKTRVLSQSRRHSEITKSQPQVVERSNSPLGCIWVCGFTPIRYVGQFIL